MILCELLRYGGLFLSFSRAFILVTFLCEMTVIFITKIANGWYSLRNGSKPLSTWLSLGDGIDPSESGTDLGIAGHLDEQSPKSIMLMDPTVGSFCSNCATLFQSISTVTNATNGNLAIKWPNGSNWVDSVGSIFRGGWIQPTNWSVVPLGTAGVPTWRRQGVVH